MLYCNMIIKKENATWNPQLPNSPELGWIRLGTTQGQWTTWTITSICHFDDMGASMDTFTIELNGETKEIYSYDEGETFTFDAY